LSVRAKSHAEMNLYSPPGRRLSTVSASYGASCSILSRADLICDLMTLVQAYWVPPKICLRKSDSRWDTAYIPSDSASDAHHIYCLRFKR
jgi:hypothetical protein